MTFQPVIPLDGYTGWRFLQRTQERQREAFDAAPETQREIEYFVENIFNVEEVADLVTDRQLLKVALGAFGLQDEINKQALVRKVLEEGLTEQTSFANRLNNSQYKDLARAFPFGDGGFEPSAEFVLDIVAKYRENEFEVAVGETNTDMRLSLNFKRKIADLAAEPGTEKGVWFRVMGDQPLRAVFETAYNLPAEFSQIDIDQQQEILAEKTRKLFGDSAVSVFSDPENVEGLIRQFLVRSQIANGPSALTPGFSGLAVLQASNGFGASAAQNLLLSNA